MKEKAWARDLEGVVGRRLGRYNPARYGSRL
jgi:hypothetical protein